MECFTAPAVTVAFCAVEQTSGGGRPVRTLTEFCAFAAPTEPGGDAALWALEALAPLAASDGDAATAAVPPPRALFALARHLDTQLNAYRAPQENTIQGE